VQQQLDDARTQVKLSVQTPIAKALGLEPSPNLLAQADEVIE